MRKLNLRVQQRQQEVQARAPRLLQLVVRPAAQQVQVVLVRERLELAQQLALRERLRERYQPLVQLSQAQA